MVSHLEIIAYWVRIIMRMASDEQCCSWYAPALARETMKNLFSSKLKNSKSAICSSTTRLKSVSIMKFIFISASIKSYQLSRNNFSRKRIRFYSKFYLRFTGVRSQRILDGFRVNLFDLVYLGTCSLTRSINSGNHFLACG